VRNFVSNTRYTHYSLLKSIEAGFRLPCLNHACDTNVAIMTDLFAAPVTVAAAAAGNAELTVEAATLPAMTGRQ
jgi:hypothetical protein